MTTRMTKDGQTIHVAASQVAQHQRLGWQVATLSTAFASMTLTVGAEDADVINVALQLIDDQGDALSEGRSLLAYLADAADGVAPTATAPDGHIAAGTNGGCIHLITDKVFLLNTNTSGAVDLDMEEAAADTWYLVVILPNGERLVSDAITFA